MYDEQHQSAGQTRRTYKTNSTTRQNVSPAIGGIVSRVHTEVLALFTSTDVVVVVVVVIDGLFDIVKSVSDVKTDEVVAGGDVTGVEVTIVVVGGALVVG